METAVRASNVSKTYEVYRRPADRLIEMFTRQKRHAEFAALEDVSFDVDRGETIGIIGQNGAGKSTLLKLLCGVTRPTRGSIETRGTIASILELGTGFHPEFSGRDNAALNATILGLSADEVKQRLPEIIEFSELGSFIDRPVKTYSSGMYMRLAFSVAVNVDPDVLVIDEALAVGDGHFQKKCTDKIREFQERGRTILFCSHALYYITSICRRTLWLDHGKVVQYGPSADVVHDYETFLLERDRTHPAAAVEESERTASPVHITGVDVVDGSGTAHDTFATGDDISFRIHVRSERPEQPVHLLLSINRAADDLQCFVVGTAADGVNPVSGQSEYEVELRCSRVPLLRGDYSLVVFAGDEHAMTVFDRFDLRPAFSVGGERWEVGLMSIPHRWANVRAEAREKASAGR